MELRRWILAVGLGVAAAALNQVDWTLLTEETPTFLFGGALALIAFVCCGRGPGLLAAVIAILPGFHGDLAPHNMVTVIYVAEAWIAYAVYARTKSLILGITGFWFIAGWLLDIVLYGYWVGLSQDYLALLLVKQLFNGLINATVVEGLLRIGLLQRLRAVFDKPEAPMRLQSYSFHGVILVVMIPSLVLGLAYTREAFWNEIAGAQARSSRTAEAASQGIRQYLGAVERTLARTARQMGQNGVARPMLLGELLRGVRVRHSELLKVAVFEVGGDIVVSDPPTDINGEPIAGLNVKNQDYYKDLVRTRETVYAPLFDPTLKVREKGGDHVIILAEPLMDLGGALIGGLVVAIDPGALLPILRENLSNAAERVTIWDGQGRVIASLDPRRPVGTRLYDVVFGADGTALGNGARDLLRGSFRTFSYYPPRDGSVESRLSLNTNYATVQLVVLSGWRVLVDLPASELLHMIVPTAYAVVGLIFFTIGVLYVAVVLLTRRISEPIVTVNRVAANVVGGEPETDPGLAGLAQSPVTEFRGLADNIMAMQQALVVKRELSEAREQESAERFRATFDQAAVGIAHVALDGKILRINQKFCDMLGRPREEVLGGDFQDYTLSEDLPVEQDHHAQLLRGDRQMYTLEERLSGQGGVIWVQLTVSVIRAADDAPRYCMKVAQDITSRKSLQEQLLQSQKMESIGHLAGGIAHDFNNLLTPMLGYSELAMSEPGCGPDLKDGLRQIHLAATRAKQLTWQLLAFSRKQVLEFQTVDLAEAIAGFEGMIRLSLRENIKLEMTAEPGLGLVRADTAQVQQILMNLVVNAQDAMSSGGELTIRAANVVVTPEFAAREIDVPEGPAIVLSVGDTGAGIAESVLPNIFEPFFTTKKQGKGSGLGLATVYGIVKQHGGGIVVDSEPGKGTTLDVYFPRVGAQPRAEDGGQSLGNPVVEPVARRQGKENVLIVEDDAAVRRLVGHALREQGYEVIDAADAEGAIAVAKKPAGIDLLLTDVILPGMNGRDLANTLVSGRPDLRVIYMSGYTRQVLSADAALATGTHLLRKPFSIQTLTDKVREVLDA